MVEAVAMVCHWLAVVAAKSLSPVEIVKWQDLYFQFINP